MRFRRESFAERQDVFVAVTESLRSSVEIRYDSEGSHGIILIACDQNDLPDVISVGTHSTIIIGANASEVCAMYQTHVDMVRKQYSKYY